MANGVDGSRATVTRLVDGRQIFLRVLVSANHERAWTIAEDENGSWFAEPDAFDALRLRESGPVLESPMLEVSATAPGYDAGLVTRFFGSAQP